VVYDLETFAFLTVNDAAVHRYGYSRDEFLGMTIKDIRPPEDIPKLIQNISKVTKGLMTQEYGGTRKRMEASFMLRSCRIRLISWERKAEIVLANDITKRNKRMTPLEESERRFRDILENVKLIAVVLDGQGKIIFCNDFLLN